MHEYDGCPTDETIRVCGDTYGEPRLSMGNRKPPPPSPSHLASSTAIGRACGGAFFRRLGPRAHLIS